MKRVSVLAAGAGAAVLGAVAVGAAPAKDPPPVASYWMDVSTASGMGAGMMGGGMTTRGGTRPSMDQIMAMMRGEGAAQRTLELRLASKQKAEAGPKADHLIPPGLQMGPSLPLLTPARAEPTPATPGMPQNFQRPKGRMLIYWGCGEHAGAGQPTVIDFAKLAAGQVPPAMKAMGNMARSVSGPTSAPGFGRWPNDRDSRSVPPAGSLLGAHKVEANYAPPIAFR